MAHTKARILDELRERSRRYSKRWIL